MKKLYYAKQASNIDDVVFFGEIREAASWLKEQRKSIREEEIKVIEVTSPDDVPKEWRSVVYWGDNPSDMAVSDYFSSLEKNQFEKAKEIYLRLKNKYE